MGFNPPKNNISMTTRLQKINCLFDHADKLANLDLPRLTAEEVEQEIQAARKEKHSN
jgi:hypothetical protein